MDRGNSVYFPRRVIPMLPEKLSNGLCSLNPDVERLAMVCDMDINNSGEIKGYKFYPAVFRSKARLTYNQVWDWLSGQAEPETDVQRSLLPQLQALYALFQILLKARGKRGAIDFETIETIMLFNEQGKIDNIVPVHRNNAHRLIEECMLAANVCASAFLESNKQPCLYRVHEGPTPEKLEGLRNFLKEFGMSLSGGDDPTAKDYAALLEKIKPRPDAQLLQTVMLRSLRQAQYSPDNVGHFGLSYEHYTHFTSPIRRYPDLLVHRSIKAVLEGARYQPGKWDEIGMHCSMTERRADEATRDVNNWLKCYYMRDRIGEEFDGTISAVVPFGVFVALDSVYVEGLVHVSELGEDYFQYDNIKHQMLGERSGKRYRLGDRLHVKLVRADLETGRIDFVLGEGSRTAAVPVVKPELGKKASPKKRY
jgi:ribonuclease R